MQRPDEETGRLLREVSLARKEAKDARTEAHGARMAAQHTVADIVDLRKETIDIQLELREISTLKRLAWGVISLLMGGAGWLIYTTISSQAQVESMQQEIRGHVSAAGHPQSMQAVGDMRAELREINATLKEWRIQKDKEIQRLEDETRHVRRRRF